MSFGNPEGRYKWAIPEEVALPILNHCYEVGLSFFDTANAYSNGESEAILGKAIKKYGWRRESLVIATKLYAPVGRGFEDPIVMNDEQRDNGGYLNQYGLSRKHIFDSVDASLKRLDLPYVDLLQIHRFDPKTPVKETMEALHDIVKSGKVRYIGASSMWTHQLLEYQYTARIHGLTEFISMQNVHNAVYREEEREMYPACQKFGMGGIPWSPVSMGFLTRPWSSFSTTTRGKIQNEGFHGTPYTDADKAINSQIEIIAKSREVSMATVAIAWSLSKPFITAPILGMSKKERVDEAVAAIFFELSEEEIKSIDDLYVPKNVVGHL
jgi:aryl-alcohol dehydrogenase-like predicted oxidoreductase